MRKLLCLAAFLPSVGFADQFVLDAPVTHVTLHPTGATVQRQVPFAMPAGAHSLVLRGPDPGVAMSDMRIAVDGAVLNTVSARSENVPPREIAESAEVEAARAEVKRVEQEIQALNDKRATHLAGAAAARAKLDFLAGIGGQDGIGSQDATALRDISRMIAEETLAARGAALQAQQAARQLDQPMEDLQEQLEKAQQALAALVPDQAEEIEITLGVTAGAQTKGKVTITYLTPDAAWMPSYQARLTRGDSPRLTLSRVAWVRQDTGETWRDVALRLSTVDPDAPSEPSVLYPRRYRITEHQAPKAARAADTVGALAEPAVEPPEMVEDRATAGSFVDGISVTYDYARPVTLAQGTDFVRIPLDEIALDAEVFARAVPRFDDTAYVTAAFVNRSGEILLPSELVHLYLDGSFVGVGTLPLIAGGEDAELSFGPIEGLRLTSTLLGRQEGDRGVLSKSNELTEDRELEVANLTGTRWDIRLRERVPYSEQEDLVIDWSATPRPDQENVDGRRGILEWRFALAPGAATTVRLKQRVDWPEGYDLH